MKKAWASEKGFTIIELLVTIAVIAILAAITIVSYTGIQQRARDSERDGDMVQLKVAIEKYHAEKGAYPAVCTTDGAACVISLLSAPLAPYLNVVPHDPKNPVDTGFDYRYVRGAPALDAYGIRVVYESKPMCVTGNNVQPAWWSGTPAC